jgi:SAM-dependent methyltransferase
VPAPVRPARLLDVGCANGEYLLQMRALGWEVEGVETDPQAVALAREAGLVVRQGLLEGVFPARSFDVVTLGHVIEHAHDPAAMLAECARVLRPGGLLWLATPNLEAAGHRAFGQDYVQLDPPRHLVLFTRQALRGLLERGGFDQIREAPRVPQALAWTFRRSLAIRRGAGSHPDRLPALPRGLLARAVLADLAAAARPRRAEEIVLVARRGPD